MVVTDKELEKIAEILWKWKSFEALSGKIHQPVLLPIVLGAINEGWNMLSNQKGNKDYVEVFKKLIQEEETEV